MTDTERAMPAALAAAILGIEGYACLAAEVLAIRVIVPYAGANVGTTSILIAAWLLALSLGYWRAEARHAAGRGGRSAAARQLLTAAVWTAVWLSPPAVQAVFETVPGPVWGQTAVYAAIVALTAYQLAQVVVFIVHAAGWAPGRGWAISTTGNVAGAVVTTLVIMPLAGVDAAALVVTGSCALAALAALPATAGSDTEPQGLAARLAHRAATAGPGLAAGAAVGLGGVSLAIGTGTFLERNAYGDYLLAPAAYTAAGSAIPVTGRVLAMN